MVSFLVGMTLCVGIVPNITRDDIERVEKLLLKAVHRICFVDLASTPQMVELVRCCKKLEHTVEYWDHHLGCHPEQDAGIQKIKKLLTHADRCVVERRRDAPSCASLLVHARREKQAPTVIVFDQDFDGLACLLVLLGLEYPGLIEDANYLDTKGTLQQKLHPFTREIYRSTNGITPFFVDAHCHEEEKRENLLSIITMVREGDHPSQATKDFIARGLKREQDCEKQIKQFSYENPCPGVTFFDLRPYMCPGKWIPTSLVRKDMISRMRNRGVLIALLVKGHMGDQVALYSRRIDLRPICTPRGKCFVAGKATIPLDEWPLFLERFKKR